jgi:hypothetical protein
VGNFGAQYGGAGGPSFLGAGGASVFGGTVGNVGRQYGGGAGGNGDSLPPSAPLGVGKAGADGVVIVEY